MRATRPAWFASIAGLCLAAAVAIAALLSGTSDTAGRVLATSIGLSALSVLGAVGAAGWRRAEGLLRGLGACTAAAALLACPLLLAVYWLYDQDDSPDVAWQAVLVLAVLALWGAHASLVLRARRRNDPPLVRGLVWTSIAVGAFAMLITDLAILDADGSGPFPRLMGIVLVIVILLTALPPLLRRAAGSEA